MAKTSRSQMIAVLQDVPLFNGLSRRQLTEVAKVAFEDQYAPGDVIVKEGDVGQKLVVLTTGTADVVRKGQTLATLRRGDVIGEIALIDGRPRTAKVVTKEPAQGVVVYATAFRKLLDTVPALSRNIMLALAARIREVDEHADTHG
jgi:CRP/FNR family cyclic AMP-dependent transcriptional regulator